MPRSKIITGLKEAGRHAREMNMTEREYVEHIRSKAQAYIAELPPGIGMSARTIADWGNTKGALSPHTMVRLCDAWLGEIEGTDAE